MRRATQSVAVFDVCDTLFSTNTTTDFLRFYGERTNDRKIQATLKRWSSHRSPVFYFGALACRLLGWDIPRARLIGTMRGHSKADLEAAAAQYASTELARRIVVPVNDRLKEHLQRGDRIILASSSLDVVIEAIARNLGVEWVASEVGFVDGTCTGRLVNDLTGRKQAAISALLPPDASLHVYTDNRSDGALLRMAERCTIILPAGSKGERWAGEACEYLAL